MLDAQLELEASRQWYAELYDQAPVGYLTLDRNGCIRAINLTGATLLGRKRSRLVGYPLAPLIEQRDRRKFLSYLSRLRRGETQVNTEVNLIRRDGQPTVVELVGMLSGPELNRTDQIHAAMVDITERRRVDEALRRAHDELELRESKARLRSILDNSPTLIFLKDIQGHYLLCNRRFGQAFHLRMEQTVGKSDAEIFPPKLAAAYRANDLKVLAAGVPMQFDEVSLQGDGPHTSIVTKFPLYDLDGKIYALAGIVTDITERRRLEAEVLRISEREHRRIAQDLHDGLGQQLAGLWCLSDVLRKNLEAQASPEVPTAAKISKLLRAALAQTRSLARGLYPVSPEPNGLMSALEELAGRITDLFMVACRFECRRPVLLEDNTAATNLYRMAQEAVANAIKHGRARRIKITLSSAATAIVLSVSDDGVGFKKTPRRSTGLGMRIMNYRADSIGASLVIQQKAGRGTEMVCTMPATVPAHSANR